MSDWENSNNLIIIEYINDNTFQIINRLTIFFIIGDYKAISQALYNINAIDNAIDTTVFRNDIDKS